jgi:hypothetical protein
VPLCRVPGFVPASRYVNHGRIFSPSCSKAPWRPRHGTVRGGFQNWDCQVFKLVEAARAPAAAPGCNPSPSLVANALRRGRSLASPRAPAGRQPQFDAQADTVLALLDHRLRVRIIETLSSCCILSLPSRSYAAILIGSSDVRRRFWHEIVCPDAVERPQRCGVWCSLPVLGRLSRQVTHAE